MLVDLSALYSLRQNREKCVSQPGVKTVSQEPLVVCLLICSTKVNAALVLCCTSSRAYSDTANLIFFDTEKFRK